MTDLMVLMWNDLRVCSEQYASLRKQFEETRAMRVKVASRIELLKKMLDLEQPHEQVS